MKKADKLEAAGDLAASKGDYKKALKKYREAAKAEPDRAGLYNKLIETHEKTKKEWKMEDFVDSLTWTMKKQELEEPAIRQLHTKLTPEWKKTLDIAFRVVTAPDDENLPELIEELVSTGEIGTRVLIELIRGFKKSPSPPPSPSRGEGEGGGE